MAEKYFALELVGGIGLSKTHQNCEGVTTVYIYTAEEHAEVEKLREENRMLHCFLETIAFTGMSADESEAHARDALKQAKGATLPTERRD